MSDDDSETATVELGEQQAVDGAPLARVASRLTWPSEASLIRRQEGKTVIRTPEGPRTINTLLDAVEADYFATRQEFESSLRAVIGTGPVPVGETHAE